MSFDSCCDIVSDLDSSIVGIGISNDVDITGDVDVTEGLVDNRVSFLCAIVRDAEVEGVFSNFKNVE